MRHACAGAPAGCGRMLRIHSAGARTSTAPPIASAATPMADSARPPSRASPAPVRPASRSLKPRSFPRSAAVAQSASCAVAATKERFQPMPRPNSTIAVVVTSSTHSRLMTETPMISSPPASARVRPMRSTTSPTTRTSAYMPNTWAPMMGNTWWPAWCWWSTTIAPVSVITPTITAKDAWPASSAGIAPGRRMISRSGAAGTGSGSSAVRSSSAMRRGSGRTNTVSASAASMNPPAASQSTASASPSRSRPASSGLNTRGPRIAPKTAPKRTSAIPCARRSGGYMSPAAARASSAVPLAAPTPTRPARTAGAESVLLPSAARPQPAAPAPKPAASTGTRPMRSMSRPAGSAASAPEARTIAGPRPSRPWTPTTATSVSEATAAESWSVAEFAASADESSSVLRRMGRSSRCTSLNAIHTACHHRGVPSTTDARSPAQGVRPIDPAGFRLRLEGRAEALAALDRVEGEAAGLPTVLGDLDRRIRPFGAGFGAPWAARRARGLRGGFRWDADDSRSEAWYPQGVSASPDGRVVLVSWYRRDTGVARLSCVDVESGRYRHLRLATAALEPVRSHAGGLAWREDVLYVCDTKGGMRVFDLARILRMAEVGDDRYAVPEVGRYRPVGEALRFSFASVDEAAGGVLVGEYVDDAPGGRLVRWPFAPGGLLAQETATDAWVTAHSTLQGAVAVAGRLLLAQSRGARLAGRVHVSPFAERASTDRWAVGGEDLAMAGDEVLTVTEHPDFPRPLPRRRTVFRSRVP